MEFNELSFDDKKDILDLMCVLSANVNHLYGKDDRPERTEEEILLHLSNEAMEYWGKYLLSEV